MSIREIWGTEEGPWETVNIEKREYCSWRIDYETEDGRKKSLIICPIGVENRAVAEEFTWNKDDYWPVIYEKGIADTENVTGRTFFSTEGETLEEAARNSVKPYLKYLNGLEPGVKA